MPRPPLPRSRTTHPLRWLVALVLGVLSSVVAIQLPAQAAVVTPFAKVFSAQTNGSIAITGNALMSCNTADAACRTSLTGTGTNGNNQFTMSFVDTDNVATTTNSSRARLTLPPGATVLFAGLYWGGATTAGNNGVAAAAGTRTLDFRPPGAAAYTTVTPTAPVSTLTGFASDYSAYADVTNQVRAAGSGDYFGANIKAGTGVDRYAGWSLVVAISDPAAPSRDLSVFNGYATVSNGETVTTPISGFLTPPTGTVNVKVGTVVYEGDQQLAGDAFRVNNITQSDALSPAANFFGSRITTDGVNRTDRSPASVNNLGLDAKVVDASGAIPNNATTANLQFTSSGDTYYPAVLTTQVDLYAPIIQGTKTVANLSGNNPAQIGDTLEYTMTFTNTGDDNATGSTVVDPLPSGVTYVPGSLRVTGGANLGAKTDAAGDDQGEYVAASRTVRVRVGPGATGTTGGTLAKNATSTVRFRVTLDAGSAGVTISNQARLDYNGQTTGQSFNYAAAATTTAVGALADLSLTKTASPTTVAAGGLLTYTLTARNAGPNPAVATRVVDTLPDGVTLVSATPQQGSCAADGSTVSCSLGDLANGAVVTTTVTVRVPAGSTATSLVNVASVGADTSDPQPDNNTAAATSGVTRAANLSITKTTSTPNPVPGTAVTYTLTVTNNGPSDATGVRVDDQLAAAFLTVTATSSAGSCAVVGHDVTCDVERLAPGASVTVTVVAQLSPAASRTPVVNTAGVTATTVDPVPGNNTSTTTVTPAAARADLVVDKTTVTSPVVPGLPVEYRITVTNNGPSDATAVQLSDPPPGSLSGIDASSTQGTCTAAVVCSLGTVAAGSSAVVTVLANVAPTATGNLVNTATVSSPDDVTPGNNADTTTDALAPRADLAITKDAAPSPTIAGDPVTFTLTVTNNGPSLATGVLVTDPLPAPLGAVSATSSQGTCTVTGNDVSCAVGSLAVGASATVTVVATTPPAGGADGVVNRATVSATTPDPTAGNNQASYTLSSQAQANLVTTKAASPTPLVAGGPVTFTITTRNTGPSDATGLTVVDDVPAAVVIDSVSPGCTVSGQRVTCARGTLLDDASWVVTVQGTVRPGTAAGPLVNSATSSAVTPSDPSPGDNTATSTSAVQTRADLSLTKTGPASVVAGETATYALAVTNAGPSDAADVLVTDQLPAGTTFVATGSSPACTLQDGSETTVVCALGDVPAATTRTVSLQVLVGASVPDGTVLTNSAQVSTTTPDPTPGNDSDTAVTTVSARADLSVVKTVDRARLVAGEEALYTITLRNDGPSTATDVVLVDTLPPGVTFVAGAATGGTCSRLDAVITCTRPVLEPGTELVGTIRVLVGAGTTAAQTNVASISSATTEVAAGDNTASVTSPVDVAGDVTVIKTAVPSPVTAGNLVTWSLTVVNQGPAVMTEVTLQDVLPDGISDVQVSSSAGSCSLSAGTVDCGLGDLAVRAPVFVTVEALLDPAYAAASIENAVTVGSATRDTNPDNDQDQLSTPVATAADLALDKRGESPTMVAGEVFDYRLDVTNLGPSQARDVVVSDTVPAGLSVVSATVEPPADPEACVVVGREVTCSLGDLDLAVTTVVVQVRPDAGLTASSVTNSATVDAAGTDPVPGNDTDSVTTGVESSADVALTKTRTAPAGPVVAGERVSWTIAVTNPDGPSTARGVVVTDQLATGLSAVTATADNGSVCTVSGGLVTCPVNVVAPGATVLLTVSALVPAGATGTLANTAQAAADTADPDPTDNASTATDQVSASADVRVTKTRTSGPVVPGSTVSWDVSVLNLGPSTARAVTLDDDVADALTSVTATGPAGTTCSVGTGNVVGCALGALAPGAPATVVVTGVVPAAYTGSLDNTASVSSPTDTTTPGNDSATSTGLATPVADLAITKARPSGPVVPGSVVTWTVGVTNAGPSVARAVRVSDDVANAVVGLTATGPSGVTCAVTAGNQVDCDLGDLAPDAAPVPLTLSGTLPASFTGDLPNTATVTSAVTDPAPANDSATVDGTAAPQADVSVIKARTSGPVVPGRSVTWRVTVTNAGPSSALDVTVTDDVADAITGLTANGPAGSTCDVAAGNLVTCDLGDLAPDTPVRLTLTGLVPADLTGRLDNTADVSSPTDTTPANNRATVQGVAVPDADVSVTKARTSGVPVPGSGVRWTVDVVNAGPSVARDVEVGDDLLDALTGVTATGPSGTTCATTTGNVVACSLGDLAPGQAVEITLAGTLPAAYTGAVDNTATVASPTDATPANNTSTSTGTADPRADVSVVKARTSGPVVPGTPVTWSLTVANAGPSVATGVRLGDDVDDALGGVTATGPTGTTCTVGGAGEVECLLDDLAPGQSVVVQVTGLVPADFTGSLANTARVSSPVDTTGGNNESTVTSQARPQADVSLTKARTSGPVVAGSPVRWSVEVLNNGPSTASTVVVTDEVNPLLTDLTATATGGATCVVAPGNDVTCDLGDLAPGQGVSVTLAAGVPASYAGTLDNTATVTSPTDTSPGNNTATSPGNVNSQADVSILKARTSGPIVPGQPVTWTLSVDNRGPSDAADVTVLDDVNDAVTGLTATGPAAADCTIVDNLVTCDLGTVAPSDPAIVITLTGLVPADYVGELDNSASVTSPTDTNSADNTSSTEGTAVPDADVAVSKARTSGPVVPGLPVRWTVTVSNTGPSTALAVVVTDDVDDAVTDLEVASPAGTTCTVAPGNRVTCQVGALAPDDAPVQIQITGDVPAGFTGSLANTAEVSSPTDTTAGNDSSRVDGPAEPDADVSVTKTRTSGPVVPGQPVVYELAVSNAGPSTARGVTVRDDLVDALDGVTATGPAGTTCEVGPDGPDADVVTCDLGDLAPSGVPVVVTVRGDLPATYTGVLPNTATVTSPTDTTPGDNASTADGVAQPSADVSILKTRSSGPIVPGTPVRWVLRVDNAGPSTARDVSVADDLVDELTGVVATAPAGTTCSVGAGNAVTCDLGDLDPADPAVDVVVTGTVPPDYTGTLDNTATIASPTDPTPGNDTSTSSGLAEPAAALSVVKQLASGPAVPGERVSWTLSVASSGPSVATGVRLTDTVDTALSDVTAVAPNGTACTVAANQVACDIASLAPTGTTPLVVTVSGLLDPEFRGDLVNTATLTSATVDPVPTDDTSTVAAATAPRADLSLTKVVTGPGAVAGGPLGYRITVTNDGPSSATGVRVSDPVDPRVRDVTATSSGGTCTVTSAGLVDCTLPVVAAGASVEVLVAGNLATDATGTVSNTAVLVPGPEADPDTADQSATVLTAPVQGADLKVVKTAEDPTIQAGDLATYRIVVTNAGPGTARAARMVDTLPAGLVAVRADTDARTGACTLAGTVVCELGDLAPGAAAGVTVVARVGDAVVGQVVNVATAESATSEADTSDNQDGAAVDVSPARADGQDGPVRGDGVGDGAVDGPDDSPAVGAAEGRASDDGLLPDTGQSVWLLPVGLLGALLLLVGGGLVRRARR